MGLCFFVIAGITFSCSSGNSDKDKLYLMLAESFENSRQSMGAHAFSELMELKSKTEGPITHIKASIWFLKAKKLNEYTTEILKYVDSLKALQSNNERINKSMTTFLINKLVEYELNMFAIDSQLIYVLRDHVSVFPTILRSKDRRGEKANLFLDKLDNETQLIFLKQLQSNIAHMASVMIEFCNHKMSSHVVHWDTYSAIIGQNTTHLKAGETLEITAGLGAFNNQSNPVIKILGKKIPLNENAYVEYKMKVAEKPGKYEVPVKISYTDQDGKKQEITKQVSYTIDEFR
jgi:hypothetical protein